MACSLGPAEIPARIAEWQAAFEHATSRTPLDGGFRIGFGPAASLAEIARLAGAERDCCRFFSFAITVDERGFGLEVWAPGGGGELVAAMSGLGVDQLYEPASPSRPPSRTMGEDVG